VRMSVVTVAYGAGPSLGRLLESLAGEADEVVVVDNGEGGDEIAHARSREGVSVVSRGQNLGYAAGSNLGAREAKGDVLVFLNPDTVVAPGALDSLRRTLEDRSIGIAMARLLLLDRPELLNSRGTEVHVSGIGWAGGYGEPAESVRESAEIAAPSGAAMAIRAETFRALGGFAEELFMYHEDLELGWRAHLAGLRVVVDPEADVFHEYEFARNPRKNYFIERNRLFFCLTAFSPRLLVLLSPVLVSTEVGMAAVALKEGWFKDKAAGWGWCIRNVRVLARRRRATQGLRKVRDRDLAGLLTPVFDPGMLPVPRVLRAANPVVAQYWRLVRRAL
jgi:GT2 family glycosyltransferase